MADEQASLRPWLVLHRAPGLGPATFHSLIARFGTPGNILSAGTAALKAAGLSQETVAALQQPDEMAIEADLAWIEQPQAHVLTDRKSVV